jgi:hypothetical protein
MTVFSTTLTVSTTPVFLMMNKPNIRRVRQILISVRSMDTAAYVALGGQDSQDKRLVTIGDFIAMATDFKGETIDITSIRAVCDAGSPVLEILGEL